MTDPASGLAQLLPELLPQLLATNAPALPQAWAMQWAVAVGWALVLALLGAVLGRGLRLPWRRLLAAGLALWTLLPGTWSPDYWLGLAFHAPSLSAMLLCLVFLSRLLGFRKPAAGAALPPDWQVSAAAIVLGYLLLLDTFVVLPQELYAWGFSPALLLGLLAISLLPWVVRGRSVAAAGPGMWIAPVSLLLFAATRLPTGNLWDAVLDPLLWLLLQFALLRQCFRR